MEERVPEIRFKGFEGPWEKRRLKEIIREITRIDSSSDAPIMMISANYGFIEQSERYAFNNAGDSLNRYILLQRNELAYNHGASKIRPYGSCFALTSQDSARVPFVYHCFSTESQNAEFLSIELNGHNVENQLRRIVCSSARMDGLLNISFEDYSLISVFLPTTEEQKQIAEYLGRIDNLIELTQQKLDQLKTLKKACLEKMFPKNGSIVPEIRFAGFADAWEQRKLGDVARILGGNAWKASDYSDDGEYLVVTIANVSGEVIINDSVGNRISCDNPDVYLLNKGDILVSLTGNVGRVSKMSNIKGLLNQRVGKILPNNSDINADFLFHVLRNPHFERAMIDAGQGAAQKNIRNDDVLNYAFFLPVEKDEQNIIAHYFNRLDNLITLHQRKLDKLKSLKQACLEKMFV